jgi:hypothetical protein
VALVLGWARRRTLVLDRGGQSNRAAAHVGGLLAQEDTAPDELYARAREQLACYDAVVIRDAEAVDARAEGEGFLVMARGAGLGAAVADAASVLDWGSCPRAGPWPAISARRASRL